MNFYFTSAYSAAIKINGVFYGILQDNLKNLRVDSGAPFVEICPINNYAQSVHFLLDSNFLNHPPQSVSVTDLKGGYLIKFNNVAFSPDFNVIQQEKTSNYIVTVFNENGLKLSIETHNDFYAESFYIHANAVDIKEFKQDGAHFIALLLKEKYLNLYVYKINDKIEKVFCRAITDFDIQNKLTTVEDFCDIAKHNVKSTWNFNGKAFIRDSADITCSKEFNTDNINEKIIPFCFLEEKLVDGEIDRFLADNVLQNKKHLDGYLGDYIGVMPPPTFRNIDEIGLIYRKTENCYFVEYFKFDLKDRKITNITKCD